MTMTTTLSLCIFNTYVLKGGKLNVMCFFLVFRISKEGNEMLCVSLVFAFQCFLVFIEREILFFCIFKYGEYFLVNFFLIYFRPHVNKIRPHFLEAST